MCVLWYTGRRWNRVWRMDATVFHVNPQTNQTNQEVLINFQNQECPGIWLQLRGSPAAPLRREKTCGISLKQTIISVPLASLGDIYSSLLLKRAENIRGDSTHPLAAAFLTPNTGLLDCLILWCALWTLLRLRGDCLIYLMMLLCKCQSKLLCVEISPSRKTRLSDRIIPINYTHRGEAATSRAL